MSSSENVDWNLPDAIVQEVKQSEEWEAVKMSILSIGIEKGRAEGIAEGELRGRAEGELRGRAESILVLLLRLGTVPESLRTRILEEKDPEVLAEWVVKASKAASPEEFERDITEQAQSTGDQEDSKVRN